MAAPTRYSLTYDFTGFQSANPNTPLPADKIEIEFNNIALSVGETITNLGLIQRSDGKLQNKIVEFDSLSDATKVLLGTTLNPRGDWAASTAYKVLDMVTVGESTYIAVSDHASGTSFTVDLTANKWQLWANPGFVDGTSFFQKFSGNGSTTEFTVSQDMGTDENGLMIFINNSGWVPQDPANYTISGTTLTFLAAPPSGTNNIFVFAPAKILSQAATYAAAAATSETNAATSETNAASSASTASTAATNAASSASTASTAATNAGNSASAAATSATNAASSASAASTSASGASTSATNAASSATTAASSASTASTAATNAASSASTASTAASTASTAATNAAASATAAATSETNAAASAAAAATSASEAVVSDYANLSGLPAIPFRPTGKYAPIQITSAIEWADGKPHWEQNPTATHDASGGTVPSYTTAKYGSICIVTTAGTLGGNSVLKGDLLMALQDNPTTAAHWARISDCTAELKAAIEAAQGAPLDCRGMTFIADSMVNPDERPWIKGGAWGVRSGRTGLYQQANTDKLLADSSQATITGITIAGYAEATTGTTLARCTRLQMSATDAAKFVEEDLVILTCDVATPSTAGAANKCHIKEAAYVRKVVINGSSSYVYLHRILKNHARIATATTIYLNTNVNRDRSVIIDGTVLFGAPSIIGNTVGWWRTLRGEELSGTISGSGSTRTITLAGHGYLPLDATSGRGSDYVQLTAVSGDETVGVTCKVSSVTTNTFTLTIPTKYDFNSSNPQSGLPTSGTIYFRSCFGICDNTSHHGGVLNIVDAPESKVKYSTLFLWKMGVRFKRSDFYNYDETDSDFSFASQTENNNGSSGRLIYTAEDYSCTGGVGNHRNNKSGRHPWTSNGAETSGGFSNTLFAGSCGNTVGPVIHYRGVMSESGAPETHEDCRDPVIIVDYFDGSYRKAGEQSYNEVWGNMRGDNETRILRGRGGHQGPVIRAFEQSADSIHKIDFDISDIYYSGSSNTALLSEDMSALTNKPKVRGRLKTRNCGYGFQINDGNDFNLDVLNLSDISYAAGTLLGSSVLVAKDAIFSYKDNTRGLTTRYGVVMSNTAIFRADVMHWDMGATYNPAEIFTDNDNVSGKTITIGTLHVSDPDLVGMPDIVTAGREGNFTIDIGDVYYNGKRISIPDVAPRETIRVPFASHAGGSASWTTMPAAETFFASSTTRTQRKIDLSRYSQCRLVGSVQTAGASGAKLYPKYRATYDTTVANWSNLSSGACEVSLTSTGMVESAWVDLAPSAAAEVFIALVGSGGDGATTPAIGNLTLEIR